MAHEDEQLSSKNLEALSNREVEVLQASASGLSNKEIADKLSLSEDTIDTHCRRLVGRLEAKNMKEAIAIGIRRGIIE